VFSSSILYFDDQMCQSLGSLLFRQFLTPEEKKIQIELDQLTNVMIGDLIIDKFDLNDRLSQSELTTIRDILNHYKPSMKAKNDLVLIFERQLNDRNTDLLGKVIVTILVYGWITSKATDKPQAVDEVEWKVIYGMVHQFGQTHQSMDDIIQNVKAELKLLAHIRVLGIEEKK